MSCAKKYGYLVLSVVLFSAFLLTGCFDQSYEPASIEFLSPANSEVFPQGTEAVTIHGRVVKGQADIGGLAQVSVNDNGVEVYTPVTLDANGEFYFDFNLAPIPDGVSRTFETSTCTFQVRDVNLKTNRERISFTVAAFPVYHGDTAMLDEAMIGMSLTEEFIDEAIPYINEWVRVLMPGLIDEMIGRQITLDMDWPMYDMTIEIVDLELGDIALDVDFHEGGWTDVASFSMAPNLANNNAMLVSTNITWPPLFWNLPVAFSVERLSAENVNLQIRVDESNTIIIDPDLTRIAMDFGGADLVIFGADLLPGAIEYSVLPLIVNIVEDILKTFDIPALPLLNESDLVFEDLLNLNVDVAIGLPGPETYETTDDAMAMRMGLALDISSWNDAIPAYFVGTPGDTMPDILAYSDIESDEDLVVAVSDDMMNQALYVLVHSGLLQNIIDMIPIADLVGDIAPVILEYSPDLEISLSMPTPPICNFADSNPNALADFGEFSITNMIVEIKNLKILPNSKPETYRFSMDAENLPIRLGLYEENGVQMVCAEADINVDDIGLEILYSTPPIANIGNVAVKLAKEMVSKVLGDKVIPLAIKMEVPDLGLPLPLPLLTLMSESILQDNYLVLKLDVAFPEFE